MIKEFFENHDHLCFKLQHIGRYGGAWKIQICNSTLELGCSEPIYAHIILDSDIKDSNADFETMIMAPVIRWWNHSRDVNKYKYTIKKK